MGPTRVATGGFSGIRQPHAGECDRNTGIQTYLDMAELHGVPVATPGDRLHALARAGLRSIPVVGSATTELFSAVIAPPAEARRVEWMNDVAHHLQQLKERGDVKLEDLQNNDAFITTVKHDSQAAIRNHQS